MNSIRRGFRLVGKPLFVNAVPVQLLDPDLPLEKTKELFLRFVDVVEIENHSYCNRVCWFCPNALIDRRSKVELMTDQVFGKIVSELSETGYAQTLVWSRYHEPLAHESIVGRIAHARSKLPHAELTIVSNGDYLDKDLVGRLKDVGLDRMMLDLYLPDGKERDEDEIEKALGTFSTRTGLVPAKHGSHDLYSVTGTRVHVTMGIPSYTPESISTRGGLVQIPKLQTYRRASVCLAPVRDVVIDYNGKGMLCCQVRSDSENHQRAIIGDLAEAGYGIFDLYRDSARARRALLSPGQKTGVCASCDVSDNGPDRLARRASLSKVLNSLPLVGAAFNVMLQGKRRRKRFDF